MERQWFEKRKRECVDLPAKKIRDEGEKQEEEISWGSSCAKTALTRIRELLIGLTRPHGNYASPKSQIGGQAIGA